MKTKNGKRTIVITISVILALVIIWFLLPIRMVKTDYRVQDWTPEKSVQKQIADDCKGMTDMEIVRYGMKKTAKMLRYTEKNRIAEGKANCVGYAKVYSAICNTAFRSNGSLSSSRPVVGQVMLFNTDLCDILKAVAPDKWKNFVKDHDFVEFRINDEVFNQDACVYDLMKKPCRTWVKKQ